MAENQIRAYLRALKHQFWLYGITDPESLAEMESHLLESVESGLRQGLNVQEAEKKALDQFGPVKVIVRSFERERKNNMQKILLVLASLMGLFIAYIDSRPTWDDTGITAGTMLLGSGLLTLLGYRRPWLIGLAIGLWTPLYETFLSRNFNFPEVILFPLLVLLISFAGAYMGWAVRLGIRKTFNLA